MAGAAHPDRASIARSQWARLEETLAVIRSGNRFYQVKLQAAGVPCAAADWAEFSERFPFTTKAELAADQAAAPPYGTNLSFPMDRYSRCHQTSGTTGQLLRWLDTAESWDRMLELWMTVYRAAGVTPADRVFCAFSFGPFLGFWMAFEAAVRLGCLTLPGGGMNTTARLRLILDQSVTAVCCTPTYAIRMGQTAADEGLSLRESKVKAVLVAGEPGGSIPATRRLIESLWPGASVHDHHGMTEVGPVTLGCPARPGTLHVMESGYYAEVIDPQTGKATAAGEAGELVLTTLKRLGSPLLRYRTGDMVRMAACERCACGRVEMALEGGILGRADDMVIVRGVNVYPSAVESLVRACGSVAEYQVRLNERGGLAEMTVVIEPEAGMAADEAESAARRLAQAMAESLSLRVPVRLAKPGELPRFEMKARRWIKEA